jgi:hypothetical protein
VFKILPLFSLFLFFTSCVSFGKNPAPDGEVLDREGDFSKGSSAGDSGFWDTRPRNGELIFIGGAAARVSRDEAIQFALLDAARKVSIFHGVQGLSVSAVSVGEEAYDFYADAAVDLAFDPEYERYIDELEFDPKNDVLDSDGSVFVRTHWTPPVPFDINFPPGGKDQPAWVTHPPETIDGFMAGVGRSNPYSRRHDTLIASYENTIGFILNIVNSKVRSGLVSVESTDYAAAASSSIQIAEGKLSQFYILETWTDPKNQAVWTLGIAKDAGG